MRAPKPHLRADKNKDWGNSRKKQMQLMAHSRSVDQLDQSEDEPNLGKSAANAKHYLDKMYTKP